MEIVLGPRWDEIYADYLKRWDWDPHPAREGKPAVLYGKYVTEPQLADKPGEVTETQFNGVKTSESVGFSWVNAGPANLNGDAMVIKNRKGEGAKFWNHVESVAAMVRAWPVWMRGEESSLCACENMPGMLPHPAHCQPIVLAGLSKAWHLS